MSRRSMSSPSSLASSYVEEPDRTPRHLVGFSRGRVDVSAILDDGGENARFDSSPPPPLPNATPLLRRLPPVAFTRGRFLGLLRGGVSVSGQVKRTGGSVFHREDSIGATRPSGWEIRSM